MSNVQIPNLPAATGLSGSEQLEAVQAGTSVRITTTQIAAFTAAAYPAPGIATVDGTTPIAASTVGNAVTISLNSQGITNTFMAPMASGTVKANVTVGSASPTDATVSQVLDVIGSTKGNILYRDTSSWAALTGGSNGQVLTAHGSTAAPTWETLSVPSGQIAPTGVVAGTYGSASTVPQYTVLASGQLSAASNVPIVIPYTSVTGLGSMATQNASAVAVTGGTIDGTTIGGCTPAPGSFTTLTSTGATNLGTIASGVWHGTAIGVAYGGTGATTAAGARSNLGAAASGANSDITSLSGLTTPLSEPQGGTGFSSYTTGDILYADAFDSLARLNDVATGNALISGGVGVAPSYGKIGLTTHVSGTLPVANGGTGATTLTGYVYGNGTGAFTAAATIPNAGLTNSSVTIGSTNIALGSTSTTLAGLTTVTLTQDPTLALEASTKQYVDSQVATVSNQTFHTACYATTTGNLTATYSNGAGGVGATLTNLASLAAFTTDGQSPPINSRILVKDQTSGLQNGIYILTTVGSGAVAWVLTRAADFDTVGTGPDKIETGAATFINNGNIYGASGWVMTTTGTLVVGTTPFVFSQTSSSSSVTVSSPLLKTGSDISLTTVPTTLGGTGLTTLTQYNVMIGNSTGNVAFAAPGTTGYPLLSTGASSNPAFGQLSLTAGVTGTLPVANGGTGTSTAFTSGSVVFAGASGTYSQNNTKLFWDNTNIRLGINTGAPNANFTILSNTQTASPPSVGSLPAGTDFYIMGANAANTRITQDAYGTGNYAAYTGRQARGTGASPTASQTDDILVEVTGRGYGATAFSASSVVRIDLEAAENFTDTAQGTYISFHTSALGAASAVERFRMGPSGQLGIGGATYGTSGYVLTSGGASAAPTWSQVSASSLTGVLPVANGGTNISSYTIGDLLYASGTTTLSKLADIATGNVLLSGGVGTAPSYGKVGLTTHVSGTLPIANGGTALTSTPTDGQLLIGSTSGGNYALGTLTASTGISVTNGSGSITIANTGVTSLTAGTNISVSASTGGVTISTTSTPTWTSETVPLISGGTGAASTLTLQSTSGAGTSDAIIFKTASQVEQMRIDTSGNVGIGTSSPNGTLTINKVNLTNGTLFLNGATTGADFMRLKNTSADGIFGIAGSIGTEIVTGGSAYATQIFTVGSTALQLGTVSNVRMTIDSSGNVGIGTSSPTRRLSVVNTASGSPLIEITGNAGAGYELGFGTDSNGGFIQQTGAKALQFFVNSSERMRIDSSGKVGIGCVSPTSKLQVVGDDQVIRSLRDTGSGGLSANDYGGRIAFGTSAGTGTGYIGGMIGIQADAAWTAGSSQPSSMVFYNVPSGSTSLNENMRITAAGNVGIGTSSPLSKLEVRDTSPAGIFSNSATRYGYVQWENTGSEFRVGTDGAFGIRFDTNANRRMTIDSSGNVGISRTPSAWVTGGGTALQGYSFGIASTNNGGYDTTSFVTNAYSSSASAWAYVGSSYAARYDQYTGQHFWYTAPIGTAGNAITWTKTLSLDTSGNLVATGNVTAYSDARLKKNVVTIDGALALVEKMRGVRYDRIDSGKAGIGVIAQEMQEVVPEVVHEGENLSVAYGNLVGVLIEAVKELSARVKELEAK